MIYIRGERASVATKLDIKASRQEGDKQRNPVGRKCDLIIRHRASKFEISSSEFAGNITEDKAVWDQGKNIRYIADFQWLYFLRTLNNCTPTE
jgi:hypothetical protein